MGSGVEMEGVEGDIGGEGRRGHHALPLLANISKSKSLAHNEGNSLMQG